MAEQKTRGGVKLITLQEVFDRGLEQVVKQGGPALLRPGTCAYRAPDGKKCHIGALIPDELYSPSFENEDAMFLPEGILNLFDVKPGILSIFQGLHDFSHFGDDDDAVSFDDYRIHMRNFAWEHGLSTAKLDELLPSPQATTPPAVETRESGT